MRGPLKAFIHQLHRRASVAIRLNPWVERARVRVYWSQNSLKVYDAEKKHSEKIEIAVADQPARGANAPASGAIIEG